MVFVIHAKASDSQMLQPWTFSKEKTKTTTKSYHQYLFILPLWQNREYPIPATTSLNRRIQSSAKGANTTGKLFLKGMLSPFLNKLLLPRDKSK